MEEGGVRPYYEDDKVTLFCGDCREIMPRLSESVSFVYADPPYGVNVVKMSGVLQGRESANSLMKERSGTLRSDTPQPFGGKGGRTPWVRPENGMQYPPVPPGALCGRSRPERSAPGNLSEAIRRRFPSSQPMANE